MRHGKTGLKTGVKKNRKQWKCKWKKLSNLKCQWLYRVATKKYWKKKRISADWRYGLIIPVTVELHYLAMA